MAIAAVILGLFAYGGYKRQQRQVATLAEGSMPHNVAPATAAGAEIAKDMPSGNVPNSPQQRLTAADRAFCNHRAICSRRNRANWAHNLRTADRFSFGKHLFLRSLLRSRCLSLGSHLPKNAGCWPRTSANSRQSPHRPRCERALDHQAPGLARK